jgi:hypothetical protein
VCLELVWYDPSHRMQAWHQCGVPPPSFPTVLAKPKLLNPTAARGCSMNTASRKMWLPGGHGITTVPPTGYGFWLEWTTNNHPVSSIEHIESNHKAHCCGRPALHAQGDTHCTSRQQNIFLRSPLRTHLKTPYLRPR